MWTRAGEYSPDDGLSLLDHSLFMGGCIFASEYFKGTEAGDLADELYARDAPGRGARTATTISATARTCSPSSSPPRRPQFKKGNEARVMWESYIEP